VRNEESEAMAATGIRGVVGSVARRAAQATARRAARDTGLRAGNDAIALLIDDHTRIDQLFARFKDIAGDGRQKAALVERICDEIDLHARVEEEIFYPGVRAMIGDDALMDEAAVEHDVARMLVGQLRSLRPGDFHYDAKVAVLGAYAHHHFDCEQRRIFPRARECSIDLVALGRALKARKRQLKGSATTAVIAGIAGAAGDGGASTNARGVTHGTVADVERND
jgi:hemerythrin HHE cation binding domain-containing protein